MPGYLCLKGHDSAEADFCSVCGAKIPPAPPAITNCFDCGAVRGPSGSIFCEICGYNFSTGAHGDLKPVFPLGPPPVEPPPPAPPPAPLPLPQAVGTWEVLITIDPSLRTEGSPEPPAGVAPVTIRLAKDSNLIGRRSEKRGVFPEISLDVDDAVSHRHALLNRMPDGSLILRDIGSSNGTNLNGAEITPLTDIPVNDGDQFTLGHWTRVAIRAVA
jgi:hypothetical protein